MEKIWQEWACRVGQEYDRSSSLLRRKRCICKKLSRWSGSAFPLPHTIKLRTNPLLGHWDTLTGVHFPRTEDVTDCSIAVQRKGRLFTYRGDILIEFLHYIKVEGLLIRGHYFPFFLGKIQGHIFKCQWTLEKRVSCSSVLATTEAVLSLISELHGRPVTKKVKRRFKGKGVRWQERCPRDQYTAWEVPNPTAPILVA